MCSSDLFVCERLSRGGVENLWARRGSGKPLVCFAGHTDVVPEGIVDSWTHAPFAADIADRVLMFDEGKVVEEGPPSQVLKAPAHPRTRQFLRAVLER